MKTGLVIGKFNFVHPGHERILSLAADSSDRIIVVTPVVQYRNINHFFLSDDVERHLKFWFQAYGFTGEVIVLQVHNVLYDDAYWAWSVTHKVQAICPDLNEVTLFGCKKDDSSFYLDFFPMIECRFLEVGSMQSSTGIRTEFLDRGESLNTSQFLQNLYAEEVLPHLPAFREERHRRIAYVAQYGSGPHLAGDAVVHHRETRRVLFIQRADNGRLAFPGGFVDPGETFTQAIYREFREEMGYADLPVTSRRPKIFDYPNRSTRGSRVVTGALALDVSQILDFPDFNKEEVLGYKWLSYEDALNEVFHDDHFSIAFNLVYKHHLLYK